jgi:hypothetical protein
VRGLVEASWGLRRFDSDVDGAFSGMLFKEFKDSDVSRWKDAHFSVMFVGGVSVVVVEDGVVVPMAERRERQPNEDMCGDPLFRQADIAPVVNRDDNIIMKADSSLADDVSRLRAAMGELVIQARQRLEATHGPLDQVRIRFDTKYMERIRRLEEEKKALC